LWNVSKVNLRIGGWVKSGARFGNFPQVRSNPMKILCIGPRIFFAEGYGADCRRRRIGGRGPFLCVDTSDDRVWDGAVLARAAPEFRGFRHPSAIGDCKAASPKETLQAPSLRAPKVVTTRVYSPAKTSLRIAPSGSGVLLLMYFQNGDQ